MEVDFKIFKEVRPLPLAAQVMRLRQLFPESMIQYKGHETIVWKGSLQPTPLSRPYLLRLDYKLKKWPKIWLMNPPLETRDGERAPHLYIDDSLCLFHPSYKEWSSDKLIADTIIPWASLWLYYYEIWLATGNWHGGGEHPPAKEKKTCHA